MKSERMILRHPYLKTRGCTLKPGICAAWFACNLGGLCNPSELYMGCAASTMLNWRMEKFKTCAAGRRIKIFTAAGAGLYPGSQFCINGAIVSHDYAATDPGAKSAPRRSGGRVQLAAGSYDPRSQCNLMLDAGDTDPAPQQMGTSPRRCIAAPFCAINPDACAGAKSGPRRASGQH